MPSILVAVEPAFLSKETLHASAALARRQGLALVVAMLPSGRRPDRPEVVSGLQEVLRQLREEGFEVQERRLEGDAEKSLVACVREAEARLVVFADDPDSTRMEGLTGAVIRSLPATLLLVRDPGPLLKWARREHTLRVMLGLDFSPPSEAALSWTRSLHARGNVDLLVTHVSWLPGQRRRLGLTVPRDPQAEEDEIRRVLFRELEQFVGPLEGVRFGVRLSLGRTADAIAFTAAEEHADLVVVGTKQRHGISRLWHGSVAGGVLTEARTNVACVPLSSEPLPAPASRPVPRLKTVLAATDFSEAGDRAILMACSLLPNGGTLHAVHVADPSETAAGEAELLRRLRALECQAATAAGVAMVVEILRSRNPAEAICGRAERIGVDVLCLGYHGRTGLGRGTTTEAVLKLSGRPILVVKQMDAGGDD